MRLTPKPSTYLRSAFDTRDNERNFHVSRINLDKTCLTLGKGSQPPLNKDQCQLHASITSLSGTKMTIRRGKGPPQKKNRRVNLQVKSLDADGLKITISRVH